ncbi:hypothetical protein EXIGLDRAFT_745214 [Exidia glandulosa HHB12029]|uniref:NAD(P)-binding protein n=1 Tax=Exidia glandulosa HHB12029 TaxID=1314781 RepID=A0A165NU77_EXIGL|nr:hypothetical protein EXIGLDRAFT_745214 [Exidia glandulosa HHB12029]
MRDPFNVVFIGAGNVMFGSPEGAWNQALRWEQKLGARLNMLAIVDPDLPRVQRTLDGKRGDASLRNSYANTEAFSAVADLVAAYKGKEDTIRAIVVGTPPAFRGGLAKGTDIELQIIKAFPKAQLFIEKPVAAGSVKDAYTVGETIESDGNRIVGVAYMLRYLKAVGHIRKVIAERGLTVMATHARYATAYNAVAKPFWWDKSLSGGPVVEQATHFCDLSRFFGGSVVPGSVQARATEWNEPAGQLAKMLVDESKIPEEQRIPRVTSANWKYESGGVGSLLHVVAARSRFFADGHLFKLEDPYGKPLLRIRTPASDEEETLTFPGDDPFYSEVDAFVDAVESGSSQGILSSFKDACGTYELTWDIRTASERK